MHLKSGKALGWGQREPSASASGRSYLRMRSQAVSVDRGRGQAAPQPGYTLYVLGAEAGRGGVLGPIGRGSSRSVKDQGPHAPPSQGDT